MLLNTFLGAISRCVISQTAVSKSICGNLNSLASSINTRDSYAGLAVLPLEEPRHLVFGASPLCRSELAAISRCGRDARNVHRGWLRECGSSGDDLGDNAGRGGQ